MAINKCKKCGGPAAKDHDICWFCEHEGKLTKKEKTCNNDACNIRGEEHGHSK